MADFGLRDRSQRLGNGRGFMGANSQDLATIFDAFPAIGRTDYLRLEDCDIEIVKTCDVVQLCMQSQQLLALEL